MSIIITRSNSAILDEVGAFSEVPADCADTGWMAKIKEKITSAVDTGKLNLVASL